MYEQVEHDNGDTYSVLSMLCGRCKGLGKYDIDKGEGSGWRTIDCSQCGGTSRVQVMPVCAGCGSRYHETGSIVCNNPDAKDRPAHKFNVEVAILYHNNQWHNHWLIVMAPDEEAAGKLAETEMLRKYSGFDISHITTICIQHQE